MLRAAVAVILLCAASAHADPTPDPFLAAAIRAWRGGHDRLSDRLLASDARDCLQLLERKQLADAGVPCGVYGMSLAESDPKEARRLLAIACEQRGDSYCLFAGYLDEAAGDGAAAERHHRRVCDGAGGGVFEGPTCARLGLLVAQHDADEGRRYLERACASDGNACLWLGDLLDRAGEGEASERRYGDACHRGSRQGCERRDEHAIARMGAACAADHDPSSCLDHGARLLRAGRADEAIVALAPLCAKEKKRPFRACLVLAAAEIEAQKAVGGARARVVALCERWRYREVCSYLAGVAEAAGDEAAEKRWTAQAARARATCDEAPVDDLACEFLTRVASP